jgi:hypothetical protein
MKLAISKAHEKGIHIAVGRAKSSVSAHVE